MGQIFNLSTQASMIAKLEDYHAKCMKDQTKQIVSVVIYSIKDLLGLYCKHPNSRRVKDLVASAKCANEVIHEYDHCNREFIDSLSAIYDSKDSKQNLAQMCW